MKTPIDMLDATLALLAASSLGATFMLHWVTRKKLRASGAERGHRPAISILKPLCGLDEGLYENLVSFVQQSYPEFELLLSVADPRDPALAVVRRIRHEYPDAPLRLIVHGEDAGAANPKVVSLVHMARTARHEHLLVSDSNVRVAPGYLTAVAAEMADPNVGLVSNMIVGSGEDSLGAHCENLHLNTFVLGGVCVADWADRPCVVGKSMLMRRKQLAALGGFDALRDVLAEDFLLGQRYHAAGYRVVLSCHAIATYNRSWSMGRFLARHLRWAQLRRSCAIGPFFAEALLYSTPWLVAPLLVSETRELLLPYALALFARVGSDGWLAKNASGRWPSTMALLFIPVKDTLLLGVWLIAMLRRSVSWRGHALRIGPGSRLLPAPLARIAGLRGRPAQVAQ